MAAAKIHGAEFPIRKIFSNDFNFKVPLYQRPYSWSIEHAGALLDDLLSFVAGDSSDDIDELSPYFLGSIVLIKDEGQSEAEVVDGQQRLTTLTILISALRHSITNPQLASGLTSYLYQEGNPLEGTPNRYRLTLRDRDADFFKQFIQDEEGLAKLANLNAGQLTDSQANVRANALHYLRELSALSEGQRIRLAQFIVKQCLLVVVSTPDLDSAYRIFSILNDRGLDLSHADILKSEIIGRIPSTEQSAYNNKWEDAEEELGQQAFGDLFGHVRMIFRKQKGRESILREFREHVIKRFDDARDLIDKVLIPYAEAFLTIRRANYRSTSLAEQVNEALGWLNRIDNIDWIPPAISFLATQKSDSAALIRFFRDLERLAAFMMISRYGINERIDRYGQLLQAIEANEDLSDDTSPLQLSEDECRVFINELNGELYCHTAKRRLYTLLRLDSAVSDGSSKTDYDVVSVEHVLPQNPPPTSKWCKWFPSQQLRDRWVHRVGNLLLLNQRKNSSAGNLDFDEKKASYFTHSGVSPFPLTTQALLESEWTPDVVRRRQVTILEKFRDLWRIDAEIPSEDDAPIGMDESTEALSEQERASFYHEIVPRLGVTFGTNFIKHSRVIWASDDGQILISCQVSIKYDRSEAQYWFGLKRSTKEVLEKHANSYCAFGLGKAGKVVILQFRMIATNLDKLYTSADQDGGILHWHIQFRESEQGVELLLGPGNPNIDVTHLILPQPEEERTVQRR